ncbi:LacI family DNA-binding transcriptional regulator [Novosphingobium mangrovi (ex Huang et al. 2023)]|uniref:LacI family transcriptional regulator n=1 Tax=Novosphingobium mangrovi (ex Huang et al. 2023) TaxID=2976432 RepID=A0ABT2I2H1_9SPHN|nr:LacI family DNA-binding transcriptional regulator [Novosphingobium mangrovi (ex Huang et al. 2023)]MCT2398999.1 LacI family transcriptional regulator [Novosphingobium mangrovi (ex Huang et al. 2023)]
MGPINSDEGDDAQESASAAVEVRTLADLARLAGVSTGTVSRALAGKSLVNTDTRERIQALAKKHGFRPNQMASKLRSRRTGAIGVVVPLGHAGRQQISDPFFLTLLGHLADELTENGYDVMLSRAIPDGTSDWLERMTGSGMVDGVLLMGQSDQLDVIEQVSRGYRPLVAWGICREGQNHCVVGTDNLAGGRMAAGHLIASGARKLVFLGDTADLEVAERHKGAAAAAAEAGISLLHIPISLANGEMGPQIKAASDECGGDVDGIVCGSDLIAMNVLHCLHERGARVPEDVQVVGFNDLPLATLMSPPLTTVRQDIADCAKAMVEKLRARIAGEHTGSLVVPPQLIVRETTRAA